MAMRSAVRNPVTTRFRNFRKLCDMEYDSKPVRFTTDDAIAMLDSEPYIAKAYLQMLCEHGVLERDEDLFFFRVEE